MAFTPPPQIPQRGARATFSGAVDAFLKWMAALPAQLDAFLAQLSIFAAGGSNRIPYVFDNSGTTEIDPGPGKLRLNNSAQSQATAIYVDILSSAGNNVSGIIDTFNRSTSAVKGTLRLQSVKRPQFWMLFNFIASAPYTGHRTLSVTPIGNYGSPFIEGEELVLFFDSAGDKGDTGNADKKVQTAPAPVGGVVTVDYRNGNCLVWNPTAGSTVSLNITNWPSSGNLGEFWIIGTNLGAATVNMSSPVSWLRADGTYAATASINSNQGATLRSSGEDNILLWSRSGTPDRGKVAR